MARGQRGTAFNSGHCDPLFEYVWRNKVISTGAQSISDIVRDLRHAADFLERMDNSGKIIYVGGAEDDYATFVTTDPRLAKKYGFVRLDESETLSRSPRRSRSPKAPKTK